MDDGLIAGYGSFEQLQDNLKQLSNELNMSKSQIGSLKENEIEEQKDFDNNNQFNQNNLKNKQQIKSIAKIQEKNNECIQNNQQIQCKSNNQQEKEKEKENMDQYEKVELKDMQKAQSLKTNEQDENAKVTFSTYWNYLKASNYLSLVPIMLILFLTCEVLVAIFTNTIGYYGQGDSCNQSVINALDFIVLGQAVNYFIKYFVLINIDNSSSENLHNKMIDSLVFCLQELTKKTDQFQYNFNELSKNSLRSSLCYWFINRVFGAYAHSFSFIAGIIGIFMLVALGKSGSQVGQSIFYFLSMSDLIQWGLRQTIQTDVIMSSTQRILNMRCLESEPELITQHDKEKVRNQIVLNSTATIKDEKLSQKFPQNGKLEFINVRMRYREGLNPVLNQLSFTINPRMRVLCIGRIGAGKSSIIVALYRLTEIDNSQDENEIISIKLDGYDTKLLGLHTLREGISMISQVPFIFNGTILRNLDPLNEYSIQQVQEVVQEIGLQDSLQDGLLTDMTNANVIFSVGQKQLICLGRAILKRSKLLILDEATTNVDMVTDEQIQNKIKERFVNSTVITVAHRLNTIAGNDLVIVMENGSVLEQENPYVLLNQDSSFFKSMVDHTGKKNCQTIFEVAKSAYLNKETKLKQN
ncbi:hypothetical protein ABPG72_013831 [Tetrahymena utriculariae]